MTVAWTDLVTGVASTHPHWSAVAMFAGLAISALALLLAACLAGYALGWPELLLRLPRRWLSRRRRKERSIEQLISDLQHLEALLTRVERSHSPLRLRRVSMLTVQYDETLAECCAVLGLPSPSDPPLKALDRIETEAALCLHGVTW